MTREECANSFWLLCVSRWFCVCAQMVLGVCTSCVLCVHAQLALHTSDVPKYGQVVTAQHQLTFD